MNYKNKKIFFFVRNLKDLRLTFKLYPNDIIMKKLRSLLLLLTIFTLNSCGQTMKNPENNTKYNKLTSEEEKVIVHKGTEWAYSGKYFDHHEKGVYVCKRCNAPLYRSADKFDSHCGWPSFDDEIKGAVERVPDADGMRTEIVCAHCKGHLGHVFEGEGTTSKNTRHCVNSISMNFIPAEDEVKTDTALFASGCFWGTEYYLQKAKGVISTEVGYTGGTKDNPTYKEVCSGKTGHTETVRVIFDPSKISYKDLTKLFFETHDPSQRNGQGPDIGTQYRSAIFYMNEAQKKDAEALVLILKEKGLPIATEVVKAGKFWKAEDYHQNYYENSGGSPYCHSYTKRF
jgi:peptide methionine sulfoxide reductase msrA/msrB